MPKNPNRGPEFLKKTHGNLGNKKEVLALQKKREKQASGKEKLKISKESQEKKIATWMEVLGKIYTINESEKSEDKAEASSLPSIEYDHVLISFCFSLRLETALKPFTFLAMKYWGDWERLYFYSWSG